MDKEAKDGQMNHVRRFQGHLGIKSHRTAILLFWRILYPISLDGQFLVGGQSFGYDIVANVC